MINYYYMDKELNESHLIMMNMEHGSNSPKQYD